MLEGRVDKYQDTHNGLTVIRSRWVDAKIVKAQAWDSQTAGYNTFNTVSVRLWSSMPIFSNDTTENEHSDILKVLP